MAWFSKEKKLKSKGGPPEAAAGPRQEGRGDLEQVRRLRRGHLQGRPARRTGTSARSAATTSVLPVRRRFDLLLDPGHLPGARRRPRPRRTRSASPTPRSTRTGSSPPTRPPACATPSSPASGAIDGHPVSIGCLRLRVHGRVDGLGGGREGDAGHRARLRAAHPRRSSSAPPAAPACRRGSSPSCRWPRPRRRSTASARSASPTSR